MFRLLQLLLLLLDQQLSSTTMSFHFQMEDDCGENTNESFAFFSFSCMIFSSIKSLYYLMEDDGGENIY